MRHLWIPLIAAISWGCGPTETPKSNDVVVIVNNANNAENNNTSSNNSSNGAPNPATNNNDDVVPPAAEEFLQRSREIACQAAFDCPSSANLYTVRHTGNFGSVQECVDSKVVTYASIFDIEGSIEAGSITYNDATAADCLRELEDTLCNGTWGRVVGGIESCRDVLVPNRQPGERCASSFECADGYCDTSRTCGERTCLPYPPCGDTMCSVGDEYCDQGQMRCLPRKSEGDACSFGQCDPFYACTTIEGGTCEPWGSQPLGSSCVIDQSCQPGLTCHDDDRICVPVVFGAAGAACDWRGGNACEPGLACRIPDGSETGTCGEPFADGETCRLDSACGPGLICDVWVDGPNVCAPLRAPGDICQSGAQCASGSCPGGMGSQMDGVCEVVCSP